MTDALPYIQIIAAGLLLVIAAWVFRVLIAIVLLTDTEFDQIVRDAETRRQHALYRRRS